jgi:hypothetical protein
MRKGGSIEGLSVEAVTRDGNCLFRSYCPLVAFEAILNNGGLYKCGKNGAYDGNSEIASINEIYEVSVDVYIVSEDQITQPSTVIIGQVVTKRNGCLFFSGELDNIHYDANLQDLG